MAYGDLADFRADYLSALDPTYAAQQDPDYTPPRKFQVQGNEAAKRDVMADVLPETENPLVRGVHGVLNDLKDVGTGLGAIAGLATREGVRLATHPIDRIHDYLDFAGQLQNDPDMVVRGAKAVASGFAEPYIPKPGESGLDVIKRNVLDRPLSTMMDAAALVGGPASIAGKIGVPSAAALAEGVSQFDPVNLAIKGVRAAGSVLPAATGVPDAVARMEANRILADSTAEAGLRARTADQQFETQLRGVFDGLDDTEKTLFFPYAEGRLKAMSPESGMAGQVGELTPSGQWQPRALDPDRLARLETARQSYLPIVDQFEEMRGLKPEQVALDYGQQAVRDVQAGRADLADAAGNTITDPTHPDAVNYIQMQSERGFNEAGDNALRRRTVSTRTALDTAKMEQFQTGLEQMRMDAGQDAADAYARQNYPRVPTSPEEAMAVMGPQGGVYFPHSGELFTRDQTTVGNILTKVHESIPWKANEGSLFRTGALETMDPEKALARTWIALRGGKGLSEIADELGSKLGEAMPSDWKPALDPDLRAGTHQALMPALYHQEGALAEAANDLTQRLLDHSSDPATAALNVHDLIASMAQKMDTTFPLREGSPVYKVQTGVGDAFKAYRNQFEPTTNTFTKWLDATADPFNYVTLNLRPARILNNVIGNTMFQVMQGIHPFSSTGIGAISDMAQAALGRAGVLTTERAQQLAKVYDLPGVSTGGLSAMARTTRTGAFLAEKGGPIGRGINALASGLGSFNESVENTARALSTIFELKKDAPSMWSRALGSAKDVMDIGDRIESLAADPMAALEDVDYRKALGNVNKFLNDYTRASPTDRTMWRRLFPYHKFYRHAINLALTQPFEQPVKTAMLRAVGRSAQNELKEQLDQWGFDWSQVPESLRNSLPVDIVPDPSDPTGRGKQIRFLNVQGPNPFSVLAADPSDQGIGALHPLIKAGLESAFGVNLWTMERFKGGTATYGGKELDPHTKALQDSTARPGPLNAFARQFFPVQIARDLVAGGRTPIDTASLVDMIHASVTGHEGEAFNVNARGVAERKPYSALDPFLRLLGPVPQIYQAPTKAQADSEKSNVAEAFNELGRRFPEMRDELRARLRDATVAERAKRAELPRRQPFRREAR